jgi:hypothetical protein
MNQPLDLKEGLWQVTLSSTAKLYLPDDTTKDFPPETRAKIIADMKASASKATIKQQMLCLTRDALQKGNLLGSAATGCPREVTSSQRRSKSVV